MSPALYEPVLLSLRVALLATALAGGLALALAGVLAHRNFAGRGVVDALLTAPLVFPPTVLGYYLLVLLGHRSVLGRLWEAVTGSSIVFTFTGAVVAATVTAFPLVFQAVRASVESVERTYVQAARTLGASPTRAFLRVTLPLASRGVMAGVVLGFARALGDFGVTLMVAGNIAGETRTAALAIYDALEAGRTADATLLVAVMTAIAMVLMVVAGALSRRPHER